MENLYLAPMLRNMLRGLSGNRILRVAFAATTGWVALCGATACSEDLGALFPPLEVPVDPPPDAATYVPVPWRWEGPSGRPLPQTEPLDAGVPPNPASPSPDASRPAPPGPTRPVAPVGPPPAATDCTLSPFSEPQPLTTLGVSGGHFGPTLSADALTLIFSASVDATQEDLFVSTRAAIGEPFSVATALLELNTSEFLEGTPYLVGNGALYYFSNANASSTVGGRDIWRSIRPVGNALFAQQQPLLVINSPGLDHLPWVDATETTLLWVTDRAASTTGSNIWRATRTSVDEPFSNVAELPNVNANSRDERPFMTADGLQLLFASNRGAQEDMNLWLAQRASSQQDFREPEQLPVVNSVSEDIDPTLSSSGLELFFSSNRDGPQQLYTARRTCVQ